MVVQCVKCKKNFISQYNLDTHMNKKDSCNIIIQCVVCEKIFKTSYELNSHINKQKQCKKPGGPSKEDIKLTNKLIVLKREEELILLREELRIARIEIKLQNNPKALKIREDNEIEEQFIADINLKFLDKCFHPLSEKTQDLSKHLFNKLVENIISKVTAYQEKKIFEKFVFEYSTNGNFIKRILSRSYLNDEYLNTRCIFYCKQLDKFYAIIINDGKKELQHISYDEHLDKMFRDTMELYIDKIIKHVEKLNLRKYDEDSIETTYFNSFVNIRMLKKDIKYNNDIKKYAKGVFEHIV